MSYDDLPKEVQEVLNLHSIDGSDYEACQKIITELEKIGYTADYGLDGEIDLDSVKPIQNYPEKDVVGVLKQVKGILGEYYNDSAYTIDFLIGEAINGSFSSPTLEGVIGHKMITANIHDITEFTFIYAGKNYVATLSDVVKRTTRRAWRIREVQSI